ncbi:MAG: hypothetical protein Q7U04_10130, partial [Bacteriovorax sp.]|nr:hypothetical protein [Bacteriovorax sp.]
KTSHSQKGLDSSTSKDSLGLFWAEISRHIPQGRNDSSYFVSGDFDNNFKTFFSSKGVIEAKNHDSKVNIVLSDDLNRDVNLLKSVKKKGNLVILKDKHPLKDIMTTFSQYEVVIYQAEADDNYYLLKHK